MIRYTILPLAGGTPYVFGGIGWQRYDIVDPKFAMADTGLRDRDSVAAFPVGAGVAYRDRTRWVGDLRGTFRPTTGSSLLERNGDNVSLNSWDVTAALGYEF